MKVLFLDVDGVLNNDTTKERCLNYVGVDKVLAKRLTSWLEHYKDQDIRIVLSSTWRLHMDMWPALAAEGIGWTDITPDLRPQRKDRGDEISAWLKEHIEVTKYAVLDDNAYNIMDDHMQVFVRTDPARGLTQGDLVELTAILVT